MRDRYRDLSVRETGIYLQAVIRARQCVRPVILGVLRGIQPVIELLHDTRFAKTRLTDQRHDLRPTVQRALPGAAQHFEFFFTADKTHSVVTLPENRGGSEAVPDPVTAAATP